MTKPSPLYVSISLSGRAQEHRTGMSDPKDYFAVLEEISLSVHPDFHNMLLRNGVVVIEKELWRIAQGYASTKRHFIDEAYKNLRAQYHQPFLEEGE